jgi:predicted permease
MRVDPGFEAAHLLTFQQNVPPRITTPAGRIAFLDELSTKLAAIPGVKGVGGTTRIPLGSTQVTTQLTVEGHNVVAASLPEVDMRRSVGDYFQTMGIPVRQGRVFQPGDRTATDGLAVVNATLARQIFKDEPVIGRRVKMGPPSPSSPWLTIIGVVGDIRHTTLEDIPRPEIYISHLQGPPTSPFIAVRVTGDPMAMVSAVRGVARDLGADPPYNISTMDGLRSESVALRRFTLLLAGLFGVLAVVLAAVGVYGVMALVVAERTDEVGVRVALGATPSRILSMLVGQAGRLGLIGVAIGIGGSLAAAQLARSALFGIEPTDILTFVGVPTLLLVIALAAAFVPALRATKISPVQAIRG